MSTFNNQVDYLFDWKYYTSLYPDLRQAGIDTEAEARNHFFVHGLQEQRQFNPFVDLNLYRVLNPDLRSLNYEQLYYHLEQHGISEGRIFSPHQTQIEDYYANYRINFGGTIGRDTRNLFDILMTDVSFNPYSTKLISPHRFASLPSEPPTIIGAITNSNPNDDYNIYSYNSVILAHTTGQVTVSVTGATPLGTVLGSPLYEIRTFQNVSLRVNKTLGTSTSVEWYEFDQYCAIKGTNNADNLVNPSSSRAVLVGNGGNDTLTGGSSVDIFFGGAGADTFVASSQLSSCANTSTDIIADFNPNQDKIDVNNLLKQQGLIGGNLISRGLVQPSYFYAEQTLLYLSSAPVTSGQLESRFLTLQGNFTLTDANFIS